VNPCPDTAGPLTATTLYTRLDSAAAQRPGMMADVRRAATCRSHGMTQRKRRHGSGHWSSLIDTDDGRSVYTDKPAPGSVAICVNLWPNAVGVYPWQSLGAARRPGMKADEPRRRHGRGQHPALL